MNQLLFSTYKLGSIELKNRVVMAPLTRSRSIGNVPGPLAVTYYSQRSEAGLIVTEGTSPSPNGLGYARIPGLFNQEHVKAWKRVTDSVHKEGAKIFVQLMHTGRVGHPLNLPAGARMLAPSAIICPGEMWTDQKQMQPHPAPEAMSETDIEAALKEFTNSAKLALQAGFDGVEIHGANGYLVDQFTNTASNQRKDRWGGSIENCCRFALEAAARMKAAIGAGRVGIRLSPYGAFNGMEADPQMEDTFEFLAGELQKLGIAYVHIVDHHSMGAPEVKPSVKRKMREKFKNTLILSGGYDCTRAEADLQEKKGDLVAFGRPFISNPRLVTKWKSGQELLPADPATFYTPGEKGYTDYPL